jgi:hypothetical protein
MQPSQGRLLLIQTSKAQTTLGPQLAHSLGQMKEQSMETLESLADQARTAAEYLQRRNMAEKAALPGEAACQRAKHIWSGAVKDSGYHRGASLRRRDH